jgi:hypothetical protein
MKKGNMYKCGFRTSCASESGVVTAFGSSLLLSFDLSTSTSLQYMALSTLIFLLFPRNQGNSQSVHNFQSGETRLSDRCDYLGATSLLSTLALVPLFFKSVSLHPLTIHIYTYL